MERHPDHWFRRTCPQYWLKSLGVICDFVGTHVDDTVWVANSSTGNNSVLKSIPLTKGDVILIHSWTYLKTVADAAAERVGAHVESIEVHLPIKSEEEIIKKYKEYFRGKHNVRIAIIDHICCPTGAVFPVKELTQVCHSHGVMVLVDGAHGPGHIQLNIPDIGADFYVGNLHKWFFSPRGCSILWVNPKHRGKVKPAVTSFYEGHGFHSDFLTQGARDDTPYLASVEAIRFYNNDLGGMKRVQEHNNGLLEKAVNRMSKAWGTPKFPIPKHMEAPFLRLVGVPPLKKYPIPKSDRVYGDMTELMTDIYYRYNIQCVAQFLQGTAWFRLSAHVYNDLDDFIRLEQAVLELMKEDKEEMNNN